MRTSGGRRFSVRQSLSGATTHVGSGDVDDCDEVGVRNGGEPKLGDRRDAIGREDAVARNALAGGVDEMDRDGNGVQIGDKDERGRVEVDAGLGDALSVRVG